MVEEIYVRKARVLRVIDGDTIDVMVDMGFRRFSVERLRVDRVNAPEMRGEERELGIKTKEFVSKVLPIDTEIVIKTFKGDAFGRWLAEVYYFTEDGYQVNLSDLLLESGLAVLYRG